MTYIARRGTERLIEVLALSGVRRTDECLHHPQAAVALFVVVPFV